MYDISQVIPVGNENAVTKSTIMNFTGFNERLVRDLIQQSETLIINVGDGYFIPNMEDEKDVHFVNIYYNREKNRARTQLKKVKRLKRYAEQTRGQIELPL